MRAAKTPENLKSRHKKQIMSAKIKGEKNETDLSKIRKSS